MTTRSHHRRRSILRAMFQHRDLTRPQLLRLEISAVCIVNWIWSSPNTLIVPTIYPVNMSPTYNYATDRHLL